MPPPTPPRTTAATGSGTSEPRAACRRGRASAVPAPRRGRRDAAATARRTAPAREIRDRRAIAWRGARRGRSPTTRRGPRLVAHPVDHRDRVRRAAEVLDSRASRPHPAGAEALGNGEHVVELAGERVDLDAPGRARRAAPRAGTAASASASAFRRADARRPRPRSTWRAHQVGVGVVHAAQRVDRNAANPASRRRTVSAASTNSPASNCAAVSWSSAPSSSSGSAASRARRTARSASSRCRTS